MTDAVPVRAARWFFAIAGIYGLIVLLPLYFIEPMLPALGQPPLSRPGDYYGFVGAAAVMQLFYLTIARDPLRYRALMLIGVLGKLGYFVPVAILFSEGRSDGVTMTFAAIDCAIGLGFLLCWLATGRFTGGGAA